jgi:hypothetical protein
VKSRHFLADTFPSPFVFSCAFTALYVAAFLVARIMGTGAPVEPDAKPPGPVPVTTLLAFATLYGLMSGAVLGIFQKRPIRIFFGLISGTFGSWINWGAIAMAVLWLVIYGGVVLFSMLINWSTPAWLLLSDMDLLADALRFDGATAVLWGAGLVLGVGLLVVYSLMSYEGVTPKVSGKSAIAVTGFLALLGIVAVAAAPRANLADAVKTMPQRIDKEVVPPGNYGFDFSGKGGGQWTIAVRSTGIEVLDGLNNVDATIEMKAPDALALATGKKTMFDMKPGENYTVKGDEAKGDEGIRFLNKYKPTLSGFFKWLVRIMMILIIASFSIAPHLCAYDTFLYEEGNIAGTAQPAPPAC